MRKIIYYVATSIDGYISRLDGDISGFVPEGNGVDKYLADLQDFDTVIMGRATYEFGYDYGLKPGQPAYPHMQHYIFSNTLKFDEKHPQVTICPLDIDIVKNLKNMKGSDIYMCGGGMFAGWLLEHRLIDVLKIKLNPLIIGEGVRLFEGSNSQYKLELSDHKEYDHGLQIMAFNISYSQ